MEVLLVTTADARRFEQYASGIERRLPRGPRVGVLGSTEFWHADSEHTCIEIGRQLAGLASLMLLTGGVEGIGATTGRSFFEARRNAGQVPRVYHLLPEGEPARDYGETLFAGADMQERREVLGRLSKLFVMEGGPRAAHEADVAAAQGAIVLPVGRSGGYAAELYNRLRRPAAIDSATWNILGASDSTPVDVGRAVLQAVSVCLEWADNDRRG